MNFFSICRFSILLTFFTEALEFFLKTFFLFSRDLDYELTFFYAIVQLFFVSFSNSWATKNWFSSQAWSFETMLVKFLPVVLEPLVWNITNFWSNMFWYLYFYDLQIFMILLFCHSSWFPDLLPIFYCSSCRCVAKLFSCTYKSFMHLTFINESFLHSNLLPVSV